MKRDIAYAVKQDLEDEIHALGELQEELRANDISGAGTIEQALAHLRDAAELLEYKYIKSKE